MARKTFCTSKGIPNNEQAIAAHKQQMAAKGWEFVNAWSYQGVTTHVNLEYRKPRVHGPTIHVQVINMTCACGSACENESGSTMIERTDLIVVCSRCRERYSVSTSVFNKNL
jgi:hypothetical protein